MVSEDVFVRAVRNIFEKHPNTLNERREAAAQLRREPDLIWELILTNFATWGNARGAKLMKPPFHDKIQFPALCDLASDEERSKVLLEALRGAIVSRAVRKLPLLLSNFNRIKQGGGPDAIWEKLKANVGREAKIKYLKGFGGIGEKYARNMMMDICCPEFEQSIAIDSRINHISTALGVRYREKEYQKHEQFYVAIANRAGWTGWELDRMMFTHFDEMLHALKAEQSATATA